MFGHVLLQVLSETESKLQELRSNSDLAFLGHGVSEDQHIFLEALQSIRLPSHSGTWSLAGSATMMKSVRSSGSQGSDRQSGGSY